MVRKKQFLLVILWVTLVCVGHTQVRWTLEACVNQAIEKSLQIQSGVLAVKSADINATQATHARYPSLNAATNVGWNFGRTIDPTRNEFVTETFFNNGVSMSSSALVYNANRINNTIKQAGLENRAAGQDLEQLKRDVALNVATLYLNILFAKESIVNARKQITQTRSQQSLLEKQIVVGNRPENDRMELEAQLATNEQTLVDAENSLSIGVLNLKQLLRISPDDSFDIVVPAELGPTTDPDLLSYSSLLSSAMATQPGVAAREWRWKSAILGEKIAASQLYPSLAVGGSLRSNYSNRGFRIAGYDTQVLNQSVYINGQEVTVGFPQKIPQLEQTPYINQFRDNLSYGVFVNLSIPIYNNYSARLGVQRARMNQESALLNFEQAKESLKITVGQALNDAKAAKARFKAAEKSKMAQSNLYSNSLKRFDSGGMNTFELTRLKTQLESAEINFLIARYEYIFRTRVLDFYLGKGITLSN